MTFHFPDAKKGIGEMKCIGSSCELLEFEMAN